VWAAVGESGAPTVIMVCLGRRRGRPRHRLASVSREAAAAATIGCSGSAQKTDCQRARGDRAFAAWDARTRLVCRRADRRSLRSSPVATNNRGHRRCDVGGGLARARRPRAFRPQTTV
jgi:hypothetical protein